jgi:hypothetical protein
MSWSSLTLCTDSDLGSLEPESTNGHWGATTWPNQRAEAKRELKIWLERDFAKKPDGTPLKGVADRVRDTYAPDAVFGYTGGLYTDLTGVAGDETADDLTLANVFVTVGTDRLYIGFDGEADALQVFMADALNAVASVLTVKYSGAAGWTALTVTDGTATSGKTFSKSGRITWTIPTDWQRKSVNEIDTLFWLELSVSVALTSGTKAGQMLAVRAPDGLRRVVALFALGYIAQNRAAQAPSTDYWIYKARNQFKTGYMDLSEALYASLRDKGGIPIDLDDDNVIDTDTELTVTIEPHRLDRR